jgi:hypothetical protein
MVKGRIFCYEMFHSGTGDFKVSLVLSSSVAKYHEILTNLAENTQIYHFGGFLGIWEVYHIISRGIVLKII